jgi:hypothetical protein
MQKVPIVVFLLVGVAVAGRAVEAGQPIYAVREYPDVTITGINNKTKTITVTLTNGSQALRIGPKTWIIGDNKEASLADLRVGQHLRVRYIPRGAQAVTLEMLPGKGEK